MSLEAPLRVGIAISRAANMTATWTTLHLAESFLRRGHAVRFIEPWDFEVNERGVYLARAHAFDGPISLDDLAEQLRTRRTHRCYTSIPLLDLLLMRVAPLNTTVIGFAELAKRYGVPVVNDPAGALAVSHKAWLASLPDVPTPPTLVTRSPGTAHLFYERTGQVVVKPARGSGGAGVSLVAAGDPEGLDLAWREAKRRGDGYVVVQAYVGAAADGEKRLVWLDGAVLGGYLRQRAPGEFRHNLKRGGIAEPTAVTAAERAIVAKLSPSLMAAGIRVAGLDLIGEQVIEVNALNPGGTFHTDRLHGSRVADLIVDGLLGPEPSPLPVESQEWVPPVR